MKMFVYNFLIKSCFMRCLLLTILQFPYTFFPGTQSRRLILRREKARRITCGALFTVRFRIDEEVDVAFLCVAKKAPRDAPIPRPQ